MLSCQKMWSFNSGLDSHERLPFSVLKFSHASSLLCVSESIHKSILLVTWPPQDDSIINPTSDFLSDENVKTLPMYVFCSGFSNVFRFPSSAFTGFAVRSISVPDRVEELVDNCFSGFSSLSRVAFCESCSLKRIGVRAFSGCPLTEIRIPSTVDQLCEECFLNCTSLSRITFSAPSKLKCIGSNAFCGCSFEVIDIPSSVEELCDRCFSNCSSLICVNFLETPSVKRIGVESFCGCGLRDIDIPNTVEELCEGCFSTCQDLSQVTFSEPSCLKRICSFAFGFDRKYQGQTGFSKVTEIAIPSSVEELCDKCFFGSCNLSRVTFNEPSHLKRIGARAFGDDWLPGCPLTEIRIPDSVEELGEFCFSRCEHLSRVTFGQSSQLRRICRCAFRQCAFTEIQLPASVEELGCECFSSDNLRAVTFSEPSSLKIITGFSRCPLADEVKIPDSVEEIGPSCFFFCLFIRSISLSPLSSLKRISFEAFSTCLVKEMWIPSSVEELCDRCFARSHLMSITFAEPSSLKRIGTEAFSKSDIKRIHLPDSVEHLGDKCFYECSRLSRVTFGGSSALKHVGVEAFGKCHSPKVKVPTGLEHLFANAGNPLKVKTFVEGQNKECQVL